MCVCEPCCEQQASTRLASRLGRCARTVVILNRNWHEVIQEKSPGALARGSALHEPHDLVPPIVGGVDATHVNAVAPQIAPLPEQLRATTQDVPQHFLRAEHAGQLHRRQLGQDTKLARQDGRRLFGSCQVVNARLRARGKQLLPKRLDVLVEVVELRELSRVRRSSSADSEQCWEHEEKMERSNGARIDANEAYGSLDQQYAAKCRLRRFDARGRRRTSYSGISTRKSYMRAARMGRCEEITKSCQACCD